MKQATDNPRPVFCTEEHLQYLDHLRGTGVTNMSLATHWLVQGFVLDAKEARAILKFWMRDDRHGEKAGGAA